KSSNRFKSRGNQCDRLTRNRTTPTKLAAVDFKLGID
ncbi:MAG: hypothetical protein ACI9Z7_000502, partial [Alteromonas macleodii]